MVSLGGIDETQFGAWIEWQHAYVACAWQSASLLPYISLQKVLERAANVFHVQQESVMAKEALLLA